MQVYLNEYQVRGTGNMVQYIMKVGKNNERYIIPLLQVLAWTNFSNWKY